MRKAKTFICKDCKQELGIREVSMSLVAMELCPQCYTKRVMNKKKEYTKEQIAEAFTDVLDGCKSAYEIHNQTGLDMERSAEIYAMYKDLVENKQ